MTILSRGLAALLPQPAERRVGSLASTLTALGINTRSGKLGKAVPTVDKAQQIAAVWGCSRLVSDTIGCMPWDVFREGTSETGKVVKTKVTPVPKLIATPDGGDSLPWKRKVIHSLMLRGNAYGIITEWQDRLQRWPSRIDLIDGDAVVWRPVDGLLTPFVNNVEAAVWPRGNLWHLTAYERSGSPVGMNPIEYAATTINIGEGAAKFSNDFFEADCHPVGMVTSDQELEGTEADDIKRTTKAAIANRDILVYGSGLQWHQLQVSPNDSQFLAAQQWSAQQICAAVFGVPPEMVGFAMTGQNVTYSNSSDRQQMFLNFGVNPWIYRLERAMTRLLPAAQTVKLVTGGVLRADIITRFRVYGMAADIKAKTGEDLLTVEEMRQLEDYT